MNNSTKKTLIIISIFLAIPFTCCGLPYSFLYTIAPTTYVYELQGADEYWGSKRERHPDYTIDNINFHAFLRGKEDYAGDHKGPRSFRFSARKIDTRTQMIPDDLGVTILDIMIDSSDGNIISSGSADSLPYEMEFAKLENSPNSAYWNDERLFNPNLSSGETLTVTVELEITQADTTTKHTLVFVFQPRKIHRPFTFWMPSV